MSTRAVVIMSALMVSALCAGAGAVFVSMSRMEVCVEAAMRAGKGVAPWEATRACQVVTVPARRVQTP